MALRIKSQWHKEDRARSSGEIAGVIAFNSWKLAMDRAMNLHSEQFSYDSPRQHMDVLIEYLIFQIQITDRLTHDRFDDEERRELITALVLKLAEHVQSNSEEALGSGNYGSGFIAKFNQRAEEYSELGFGKEGPSYPFLRHLGHEIQCLMGDSQENRWVIDQVMDKDGPEIYKQLVRTLRNML